MERRPLDVRAWLTERWESVDFSSKVAQYLAMPFTFTKDQKADLYHSLQRYFSENLDAHLNEMQANLLVGYIMDEVAPFAYNQGVEDAQRSILKAVEELPGTCFQEPMIYWDSQRPSGGKVRRKPGG